MQQFEQPFDAKVPGNDSCGTRREFLAKGACAAGLIFSGRAAAQEGWPDRPVTLVVNTAPGGSADTNGRLLAQKLGERWRHPMIVVNKAGGSGSIGALQVAQAAPDGYTLLLMNNASNGSYEILNPKTTRYRSDRDFAPVCLVGVLPSTLIVSNKVPASTASEFIELVRRNPGKYSFSSANIGAASHLTFELLQSKYKLQMLHVPFNGASPAIQAVAAGDVDAHIGPVVTMAQFIQAGKVRALAVLSKSRSKTMPDLPTLAEAGYPDAEWESWLAVAAPAKVPEHILEKINRDMREVLEAPDFKDTLLKIGTEATPGTRAQMAQTIKDELARTAQVVRAANIPLN